MLTLVASALAGGDCIDDAARVAHRGNRPDPGPCVVKAPSTLGTFLRSFRWGHVRQLRSGQPRAACTGLVGWGRIPATRHSPSTWIRRSARHTVWPRRGRATNGYTGKRGYHPLLDVAAGTGDVLMARLREVGRANIGVPPTSRGRRWGGCATPGPVGTTHGCGPTAASTPTPSSPPAAGWMSAVSITVRQHARLRSLIEAIPEQDWTPIPYWNGGRRRCGRNQLHSLPEHQHDAAPVRLIVRRVKPTPGSQWWPSSPPTAITASSPTGRGKPWHWRSDHRRHAEIENAIRDLKYGVGLNHLPSGRFPANGAWLAVQVTRPQPGTLDGSRIGLGEQIVTTKTLRRRFFSMAGIAHPKSALIASLCICPSVGPGKPSSVAPSLDSERCLSPPDGARPPLTRHPANVNVPANSHQLGPRASLAASYPGGTISLVSTSHCRPTSSPPKTPADRRQPGEFYPN